MILKDLINWLEQQNADDVVIDGFGHAHCDRGYYQDVAFSPVEKTTFGEMLKQAKNALGNTYTGWKGGDYTMNEYTDCRIGEDGVCGEEITSAHLKLWILNK